MASKEARPIDTIPVEALGLIFSFLENPSDRHSVSLVCKMWHHVDNLSRTDITVAFCYSSTPSALTSRFKNLQSLKLKGKPRAAMFNLIPEDWGAYAEPWVREVAINCSCLTSLHFRRMVVSDADLITLARERPYKLQKLKLDKCSGFSTDGLEAITQSCRFLRVLFLDESLIDDKSGKWLHYLALHNSSLEVLNFSQTLLKNFDVGDWDTLAANCKFLSSLKLSGDSELKELTELLNRATNLKELGGFQIVNVNGQPNDMISLPKGLTSLVGLAYMDDNGDDYVNSLIQPSASGLRKLDLQMVGLSVEGHCRLLRHCSNLEVLEVLNGIGDEGLEVVANNCKNLRRLRVESGDRDLEQGYVTQRGLISIAHGCQNLEYVALYMSNINNAALVEIGKGCPKLKDFRLVLLADDNLDPDFPLDSGVRALLLGCTGLTRFALYLRRGSLTDKGMQYIGMFGSNLRWALLGLLGETDKGFSWLADGCPKLERLEMRDCVFTEAGISRSVVKMKALKYIWVQGYNSTSEGRDLLAMRKPYWNIEFIPEQSNRRHIEQDLLGLGSCDFEDDGEQRQPAQFLAYHSLAGRRTDCPPNIMCLLPNDISSLAGELVA